MKTKNEIKKVIILRKKDICCVNGVLLPAYSELYYVNVIWNDGNTTWSSKYHTVRPAYIDGDGSQRSYVEAVKEGICDELYCAAEDGKLKEFIENERKTLNDYIDKNK